MNNNNIHQGRNIRRFREMLGLKQTMLVQQLGEGWSQKKVSLLENKEEIDPAILDEVARALKVPKELIEKFSEEGAMNIIATTFNNHDGAYVGNYGTVNFNPIDKWIEALEENKKLVAEQKELYERLLQAEKEKIAMSK